jgi:hypothetical protein
VILEAYDEYITKQNFFFDSGKSCGFARVPKFGKKHQKLGILFCNFLIIFFSFLGNSTLLMTKKNILGQPDQWFGLGNV